MSKTIIRASVLYDGHTKYENVNVIVEDDKIVDINSDKNLKADYEGFVTPAFIDPHCHIGMFREGEPGGESEGNEIMGQILPLSDPLDSIYFDDRAFKDSVEFGVLYSCVVPGSGNLVGGKAMIIKNFGKNRDEAFMQDYGYKMALGFNPRSTTAWKGIRPNTRMGVNSMLEEEFDKVLLKKAKAELTKTKAIRELNKKLEKDEITKDEHQILNSEILTEYEIGFTPKEKAILEIVGGKKTVKIHVHKEDDVLYLIKLVKKYGIKATAEHTGDVHHQEIFDKLAENNIPVIFGPLGCVGGKIELKHAYYTNAKLLMQSKAKYGLMTDHPVITQYSLRDSLKFFMIHGMSREDAISLITYKNAEILGIDDILGSIEKGKLASLVVWDKDPLGLDAFPTMVMGEGKKL